MFRYILKRIRRTPILSVALLLFAVVVSVTLCGLYRDNVQEQAHYEQTWRSIPVPLTVTNLAGTQTDDLSAPAFTLDVFRPDSLFYPSLSNYIKELKFKLHHDIQATNVPGFEKNMVLVGINALSAEKALSPENGAQITYLSDYDESVFSSSEPVCILPQAMYEQVKNMDEPLKLQFCYRVNGLAKVTETELEIQVAGYFAGANGDHIYCPYQVLEGVYAALGEERVIDSVSGILSDNELLEELKEKRQYWFAAPNATGVATDWGAYGYRTYPNALDIDDSMLAEAKALLESSLSVNRICAIAVLVLSAAAGFFVGLLVIRSRKREMGLLRSMGTPNFSIFLGFALENVSCIALGTLLGGITWRWTPLGQLLLFVLIYAISMIVSLLIFMNSNLLAVIKEDE